METDLSRRDRIPESFSGLFVFEGNVASPPTGQEAALKVMETRQHWIVFSEETDSECTPPFTEKSREMPFCHVIFSNDEQGTKDMVALVQDWSPSTVTVFWVMYKAGDVLGAAESTIDGNPTDLSARVIKRYLLEKRNYFTTKNIIIAAVILIVLAVIIGIIVWKTSGSTDNGPESVPISSSPKIIMSTETA